MIAAVRKHAVLISVIVSLGLHGVSAGARANALEFSTWSQTTSFPDSGSEYDPVEYNGYIYAVGGWSGTLGNLNSSYFARVNLDGSLGPWMTATPVPESGGVGLTVYNDFLYAGYGTGNVYWAAIDSNDGSLGPWQGPSTPMAWRGGRLLCKAYGGYIYVLGGFHSQFFYDVYYAPINADGSLGDWIQTTSSPTSHHHFTHFFNGRLYIGGGINSYSDSGIVDGVYSIAVNPDGSLGDGTPQSWRSEVSLPQRLWQFGTVHIDDRVYLFGGLSTYGNGGEVYDIYEGTIEADGTIVQWTAVGTVPGAFPVMIGAVQASSRPQVYLIGGRNSVDQTDEVWISCYVPDALISQPSVPDLRFRTRMRYLTFLGGTPDASEAVRVQFDVDGVTRTMYVGQPFEVSESSQDAGSTPPTFWAAPLQCDPLFTDWSIYPAIHAFDESVVPSSVYDLSLVASACQSNEAAYSVPLTIVTSQWGDAAGEPYAEGDPCSVSASGYMDCWSPPDGDADFDDITSVVDKFRNLPGAPAKSRADVAPEVPDRVVDFTDIPAVVDGFRGLPYPYPGPPTIDPCMP